MNFGVDLTNGTDARIPEMEKNGAITQDPLRVCNALGVNIMIT
jgi:hypothetical protein